MNTPHEPTDVWVAMADHFLDTETRHDIPRTALACVRAGLSVEDARGIWMFEVTPAVAFNVWSVAGERGGWDPDWLLPRVRAARARRTPVPRPWHRLAYRLNAHLMHGVWLAIENFMHDLLALPDAERDARAATHAWLARLTFDFCPEHVRPGTRTAAEIERMYDQVFVPAIDPAVFSNERKEADARVRAALQLRAA